MPWFCCEVDATGFDSFEQRMLRSRKRAPKLLLSTQVRREPSLSGLSVGLAVPAQVRFSCRREREPGVDVVRLCLFCELGEA